MKISHADKKLLGYRSIMPETIHKTRIQYMQETKTYGKRFRKKRKCSKPIRLGKKERQAQFMLMDIRSYDRLTNQPKKRPHTAKEYALKHTPTKANQAVKQAFKEKRKGLKLFKDKGTTASEARQINITLEIAENPVHDELRQQTIRLRRLMGDFKQHIFTESEKDKRYFKE